MRQSRTKVEQDSMPTARSRARIVRDSRTRMPSTLARLRHPPALVGDTSLSGLTLTLLRALLGLPSEWTTGSPLPAPFTLSICALFQ
ncbi:hypothetical protein CCMA1212_002396 [Trichoderma ghanense]|uniref:Uncharacterized protein n=1 Tax=Trichoderma ghanense TaxID=65468 RepID=A0ABY2HDE3_9HYPO